MHTRIQNKGSSGRWREDISEWTPSMWQQDLQRTENSGRTLCMPPTLQLEDGTRRRWWHLACKSNFILFWTWATSCLAAKLHRLTAWVDGAWQLTQDDWQLISDIIYFLIWWYHLRWGCIFIVCFFIIIFIPKRIFIRKRLKAFLFDTDTWQRICCLHEFALDKLISYIN